MVHLVTAVIDAHRLEPVTDALRAIDVQGMTVAQVHGTPRPGDRVETYRGSEVRVDFAPKVKIEIVCDTFDAEFVASVIAEAAHTGQAGDGKVWISPLERFMAIRTHAVDVEAI